MYSVVLIDDEPWALLGIRESFAWPAYGFRIDLEETRAELALAYILENRPDVVFTDIRMDTMTGIELISAARREGLQTEFVIISGYDDFRYAQTAIKEGVFRYVLKPVDIEATDELLQSLSARLEAKRLPAIPEVALASEECNLSEKSKYLADILGYIEHNYNRQISLTDLANRFYISPTYICDLFRKHLGKTFVGYLADIRFAKAAELMASGDDSIQQISEQVGYSDHYYFIRIFKKRLGLSPQRYRKLHGRSGDRA